MSKMRNLPDGSGFFVGTIGPREPGIINWLKYRRQGSARMWLFKWRMYRSGREFGASHWTAILWAWRTP